MNTRAPDPRIVQFELDCQAAGTTPLAVVTEAGLHRTAWFRWKSGAVSPNFRKWDRVQGVLQQRQAAHAKAA